MVIFLMYGSHMVKVAAVQAVFSGFSCFCSISLSNWSIMFVEKQTQTFVLWCSFHVIEIDVIGGICVFYL